MSLHLPFLQRFFLSRKVHQRLVSSDILHALYKQQKKIPGSDTLLQSLDESTFVIMDTETTGFHAYSGDQIVSIAMIEYHGLKPSGKVFESYINPQRPIPAESSKIHHITDADVENAPTIEEALPDILAFLGQAVIVGHHIQFDIRFLNKTLKPYLGLTLQNPWLDTMLLFLAHEKRLGHYQLEEATSVCGIEIQNRHTALGDARATGELFTHLARQLCQPSDPVYQLKNQQVKSDGL